MRGGFTLLEVCLGGTLSLLLGLIMIWTLIPTMRYASWGYGRAEVVQASAQIAGRLVADLQSAPLEALTLPEANEKGLLGMHGITAVTDTGQPVYLDHLVLYNWEAATGSLQRLEWKQGVQKNLPTVFSLSQIRQCFNRPNNGAHTLARGILREFSLSGVCLPLKLHLLVEVPVPGREPQRYSHDQEIYLRNGTR
ncbi:MAG: hypothetical protein U0931_27680 [Vulcanimicrobiota bacterium]